MIPNHEHRVGPVTMLDLPWEDVVYRHIFSCLSLPVVFQLRAISTGFQVCVDNYFSQCRFINLTQISNRITKQAFEHVAHRNAGLQSLVVRNCKSWMNDALLVPTFDVATRLTHIDLTNCTGLTDASIQKLAISCTNIQVILLRDCHWLSKEGVLVLVMNSHALRSIDLAGCWQLDDDSVILLAALCKKLQYLCLAKIYGLTDECIIKLSKTAKSLEHLSIQGCWRVTDHAVRFLGEYCHSLKALEVCDCRDVTEQSLARIRLKGIRVDKPQVKWKLEENTENYLHQQRLNLQV